MPNSQILKKGGREGTGDEIKGLGRQAFALLVLLLGMGIGTKGKFLSRQQRKHEEVLRAE